VHGAGGSGWSADTWSLLLRRIQSGKCTPFLGAGACYGTLPLGADIARGCSERYGYPLEDSHDLARVAQFLAVREDSMFPVDPRASLLDNGSRVAGGWAPGSSVRPDGGAA
jgi:hypothetical protein